MSSLSPSMSESVCPCLLFFIGLVSSTSVSIAVRVSSNLLPWAAWTDIAAECEHDEHENRQHKPSAFVFYPAWFPCPSATG
eukprot:13351853-Heterocapsa_arctica.AAC.1